MKRLLLIFSVLLLCTNVIADDKNESTKQKELEKKIQLLEKQLKLEKLKKQLKQEKKNPQKKKKKTEKKIDTSNDPFGVLEAISSLGTFQEPTRYPEGMQKIISKCNNFTCISEKAVSKMSLIFKRTDKYNARNPGNQIKGMALFEIFYLQQLKKKEKKIEKFLTAWPEDRKNTKAIVAIIKLNKSREKMRKALGMDLNTSSEDAIEAFWLLGEFLDQGKAKKQKVNKDLKKRKILLANYKKSINRFKSKINKKDEEEFYKKITDKE